MLAVVKIGSSSVTAADGRVNREVITKLCSEVAARANAGDSVVVVTSGAIAAGLGPAGFSGTRPSDPSTLQAIASVGQPELMRAYAESLAVHGRVAGQVLLAPGDFSNRRRYLQARRTIGKLLEMGVVPVVNENDATADDEIRFGDNDRLSALVANMVHAELLVILTDTAGLFTADPRFDRMASLVEEVTEVDHALEAAAGGPGSAVGSGGMASKLAAAKIAAWSGMRTVIADALRPDVVAGAMEGKSVGTTVHARNGRMAARKLWIAFAVAARGTIHVDRGAREALVERGTSLLAAGLVKVSGDFDAGDAVEIAGDDGVVFAKGLIAHPSGLLGKVIGRPTAELPSDSPKEVVHRDDLVLLRD